MYTNPKYMTQIVAGSPGDIEVTSATSPEGAAEPTDPTDPGACIGSVVHPSIDKPIAACRANCKCSDFLNLCCRRRRRRRFCRRRRAAADEKAAPSRRLRLPAGDKPHAPPLALEDERRRHTEHRRPGLPERHGLVRSTSSGLIRSDLTRPDLIRADLT